MGCPHRHQPCWHPAAPTHRGARRAPQQAAQKPQGMSRPSGTGRRRGDRHHELLAENASLREHATGRLAVIPFPVDRARTF
jgi:hypothetical protein